ncbi:MAG: hypothetical protein ACI81L_003581 [Verrucomicrobiales bacterium]|jgi:hypothetical protein
MSAFDLLSGFFPLVVLGLLTVGVFRLARRSHGGSSIDPAAFTRQVAFYGLLYISMIFTATGLVWVFDERTDSVLRPDNQNLAQGLALFAIGLPVFGVLLRFADRRLFADREERESLAWSAYLTIASITALIMSMVGAFQVITSTIDGRLSANLEASDMVLVTVWALFFYIHWVHLRSRHGIRGDLHLAFASLVGLVPMAIGQAGLLAILIDRLYDDAVGRATFSLRDDSAPWLALFLVGCAVWIGVWLRRYESATRSESWYIAVLPLGTLGGFIAVLATSSRLGYLVLVWAVGDRLGTTAAGHFDSLPQLAAIGVTGAASWLYHRSLLSEEATRTDAIRSYDYLLMAASLVAGVIGAVIVASTLLDDGATDKNSVLAGITLLVVGGATWSPLASRVVVHQTGEDGLAEIASPVRRSYVYAALGAGGLATLIAAISALEGIFEDTLNANAGVDTLIDQREQLAIVVIVGAVLWFHTMALRRDQQRLRTSPPTAPAEQWPSRIIVLGPIHSGRIDVEQHPGCTIEYWHRIDGDSAETSELDIDVLGETLASQAGGEVLVLVDGGATTVIPFER